jgi:uncharacterized membrane protein YwzB
MTDTTCQAIGIVVECVVIILLFVGLNYIKIKWFTKNTKMQKRIIMVSSHIGSSVIQWDMTKYLKCAGCGKGNFYPKKGAYTEAEFKTGVRHQCSHCRGYNILTLLE